jgi:NAD(P)-dependent dehydrogenase (short-subunit alcohol dehydrogenase family)
VNVHEKEAHDMSVTVVTGANSGMGRSCVDVLLGSTDHLVAVDLDQPEIDGAKGIACDVSDPAAIKWLVQTVQDLGAFTALAHAAGVSPTMADARRIFDVNLVGTELLLRAFEDFAELGTAAVCFSSMAAYQIAPFTDAAMDAVIDQPLSDGFLDKAASIVGGDSGLAYSLSKRGVVRACARAAVRWGQQGARVNSIAPGIIDTPMGRRELEHQPVMHDMLDLAPFHRLGTPLEVAGVVKFLLSEAASFVSGIDVLVDGANIAGMAAARH